MTKPKELTEEQMIEELAEILFAIDRTGGISRNWRVKKRWDALATDYRDVFRWRAQQFYQELHTLGCLFPEEVKDKVEEARREERERIKGLLPFKRTILGHEFNLPDGSYVWFLDDIEYGQIIEALKPSIS